MPVGVFAHSGLQIIFLQNPPYMPRVRLMIEGEDSGWKIPGMGEVRSNGEEKQILGIGGLFDSEFSLYSGDYQGEFQVKFQSITGAEYRYDYDVTANFDGDFSIPEVESVRRIMPWGDVLE